MAIDLPSLHSLFERFPNRKEMIERFFNESEAFQTLCEDRWKCAEALRHWSRSDEEVAAERRQEYDALLLDLESEIVQSLDEFNFS